MFLRLYLVTCLRPVTMMTVKRRLQVGVQLFLLAAFIMVILFGLGVTLFGMGSML